jgi:hypothetical protein
MDGTVQVRIMVRKYTWHEFVHDVVYVLYATIMISNALCKRFFHLSIPGLYHRIVDPIAWFLVAVREFIKKAIFITGTILLALSVLALIAFSVMDGFGYLK